MIVLTVLAAERCLSTSPNHRCIVTPRGGCCRLNPLPVVIIPAVRCSPILKVVEHDHSLRGTLNDLVFLPDTFSFGSLGLNIAQRDSDRLVISRSVSPGRNRVIAATSLGVESRRVVLEFVASGVFAGIGVNTRSVETDSASTDGAAGLVKPEAFDVAESEIVLSLAEGSLLLVSFGFDLLDSSFAARGEASLRHD